MPQKRKSSEEANFEDSRGPISLGSFLLAFVFFDYVLLCISHKTVSLGSFVLDLGF